ncbi:hypothetical protein DFS34DRAFT_57255 [Phlyctochytrium arcticum]|nr:hypothetical protein DFS34DRAFT_57255 [Phlyctochytrium arcticum]
MQQQQQQHSSQMPQVFMNNPNPYNAPNPYSYATSAPPSHHQVQLQQQQSMAAPPQASIGDLLSSLSDMLKQQIVASGATVPDIGMSSHPGFTQGTSTHVAMGGAASWTASNVSARSDPRVGSEASSIPSIPTLQSSVKSILKTSSSETATIPLIFDSTQEFEDGEIAADQSAYKDFSESKAKATNSSTDKLTPKALRHLARLAEDGAVFSLMSSLQRMQSHREDELLLKRQSIIDDHEQEELAKDIVGGSLSAKALLQRQRDGQKGLQSKLTEFDKTVIIELEKIRRQQQEALSQIGVPLFAGTNDSEHIRRQKQLLGILDMMDEREGA